MSLVPAICTQCGAKIEIDSSKDAGICKYCGTPFVTEKVINQYNITFTNPSVEVDAIVRLAESALESQNGKEAINYANKALEMDPESVRAWLVKMKAPEYTELFQDPPMVNVREISICGENAIKYSNKDSNIIKTVYDFYLRRCYNELCLAVTEMKDLSKLNQFLGTGNYQLAAQADAPIKERVLYCEIAPALGFINQVPEEYIQKDDNIQIKVVEIANKYIEYCRAEVDRMSLYKYYYKDDRIQSSVKLLKSFEKGLTDEKLLLIDEKQLYYRPINPNNTESGGCYVATAVYGSYDCPQVWTLRRFRDYTLAETWYGRAFIHTYYAISPTIVKWFGRTEWFKNLWKPTLDKMVSKLNSEGVADTPYKDRNW